MEDIFGASLYMQVGRTGYFGNSEINFLLFLLQKTSKSKVKSIFRSKTF